MKDGIVIMYCKDGIIYPVALTEKQEVMLQAIGSVLSPLTIVTDQPQGQAVDLLDGDPA